MINFLWFIGVCVWAVIRERPFKVRAFGHVYFLLRRLELEAFYMPIGCLCPVFNWTVIFPERSYSALLSALITQTLTAPVPDAVALTASSTVAPARTRIGPSWPCHA
jgi:hypothetical protein